MSGSNTPDDVVDLNGTEKANLPTEYSSSIDEKALVRKMDFKILPMLFIVYVAAFLDRLVCSISALLLRDEQADRGI